MSFYHGRKFLPQRFRLILLSVLQGDGLPFSQVLSEKEIQTALEEEGVSFATEDDEVYTPAITLWAFLSQVLHKAEQRSCLAAVERSSNRQPSSAIDRGSPRPLRTARGETPSETSSAVNDASRRSAGSAAPRHQSLREKK